MTRYAYTALDQTGKKHRGFVEADTLRNALRRLQKQNQIVLSIEPATALNTLLAWLQKDIGGKRSVPLDQQVYLARSMGTLLSSGMTLEQTLNILEQGRSRKRVQSLIRSLLRGIREGRTLTETISQTDVRFDPVFVGMVQAAEQSGLLAECLTSTADTLSKKSKARRGLINALIYPAVLLLTSVLAFGFLFTVVIPRLRSLFVETGQDIPLITRSLLAISDGLQVALPLGLPITICLALALAGIYTQPWGRHWFQRVFIRLPLIGPILRLSEVVLLTRSLGLSFQVGMVASTALATGAKSLSLEPYRSFVLNSASNVRQGERLSASLAKAPRLIPSSAVQIMEVGEISGDMVLAMRHVADLLEEELDARRTYIVSLTTPVFLLLFGGLTATVMFAVWSSVLSINNTVLN